MQVALTDKRSNAAIVTVISHLRKTAAANKLATMQSIVRRGARVGAMRLIAVALSSIFAAESYASDAEAADARRCLLDLAADTSAHRDARIEAVVALGFGSVGYPGLRALTLQIVQAGAAPGTGAAEPEKLVKACVNVAMDTFKLSVRCVPPRVCCTACIAHKI